ncbi:MAG: KUP/HAK/KT family potassium transporter, partial [Isosphaeraceae bacterium]
VTVKYSTFVMHADHNGEGEIFALLALVPERFRTTPAQTGSERRSIFDHLLR